MRARERVGRWRKGEDGRDARGRDVAALSVPFLLQSRFSTSHLALESPKRAPHTRKGAAQYFGFVWIEILVTPNTAPGATQISKSVRPMTLRLSLLLAALTSCRAFFVTPLHSRVVAVAPRTCSVFCLVTAGGRGDCRRQMRRVLGGGARAREYVDELSTEAEDMAEKSAASAVEQSAAIDNAAKFKLSMLGDMKAAQDANIDANSVLADAVAAAEHAEKLEILADEAMAAMEKAIEQHLIDFPDSELREDLEE